MEKLNALLWLLAATGGWLIILAFLQNRQTSKFGGAYKYCPGCARKLKLLDVDGKSRMACSSCGFVHWNNPIAVSVILIPHGDGLVFVRRKFNPGKGKYALPAGFVDPHESPEEAAVREAREETSLDIEIVSHYRLVTRKAQNQVLHFFLAKPVSAQPLAGDDAEECIVAKLDTLPGELAFDSHRQVIETYFGACRA